MSPERSVRDVFGLYNEVFGGADGIRTHDLLDAIEARSQLRHGPTGGTTNSITRSGGRRPKAAPHSRSSTSEDGDRMAREARVRVSSAEDNGDDACGVRVGDANEAARFGFVH